MLAERFCSCGVQYETEVLSILGAEIPKLTKCSPCLERDASDQREAEMQEHENLKAREAAERMAQDPDEVLKRYGFRDVELAGKDLRCFDTPTDMHAQRLEIAKHFAGGKSERPGVVFSGPPGRGKTHLARGIARSWVRQGKDFRYWKLQDIIAECKSRFGNERKTADEFIAFIGSFPGLVIIDELGRSRGDQWDTDNVVYPLTDRRMALPTIWISNFNLAALGSKYDEAVVSRLMRCQVVAFPDEMEDFRRR